MISIKVISQDMQKELSFSYSYCTVKNSTSLNYMFVQSSLGINLINSDIRCLYDTLGFILY